MICFWFILRQSSCLWRFIASMVFFDFHRRLASLHNSTCRYWSLHMTLVASPQRSHLSGLSYLYLSWYSHDVWFRFSFLCFLPSVSFAAKSTSSFPSFTFSSTSSSTPSSTPPPLPFYACSAMGSDHIPLEPLQVPLVRIPNAPHLIAQRETTLQMKEAVLSMVSSSV